MGNQDRRGMGIRPGLVWLLVWDWTTCSQKYHLAIKFYILWLKFFNKRPFWTCYLDFINLSQMSCWEKAVLLQHLTKKWWCQVKPKISDLKLLSWKTYACTQCVHKIASFGIVYGTGNFLVCVGIQCNSPLCGACSEVTWRVQRDGVSGS